MSEPIAEQTQQQQEVSTATTIFVRCKHIVKVHDLFAFLSDCREELGLSPYYEEVSVEVDGVTTTKMQLKDGAPLEAVFVSGSRKPFCLIEFTGQESPTMTAALLQLSDTKRTFKSMPVEISKAAGDISVTKARKRNEMHAAQRPAGVPSNVTVPAKRPRETEQSKPAVVQVMSFVPRTVRR